MIMTLSSCLKPTDWRPLYRAAMLETDKKVLPQRVAVAEAAVIARRREIFYADGIAEEKEALEESLYALHAFKTLLAARRCCMIPYATRTVRQDELCYNLVQVGQVSRRLVWLRQVGSW